MSVIPVRKAPALGILPTTPSDNAAVAPSTAVTAASRRKRALDPPVIQANTASNRQAMPQIAAVVDQLREVFGPVQVILASEGGKELGREPPPGVIAHAPHIPSKSRKGRQL